jgi:hypothetical protein
LLGRLREIGLVAIDRRNLKNTGQEAKQTNKEQASWRLGGLKPRHNRRPTPSLLLAIATATPRCGVTAPQ